MRWREQYYEDGYLRRWHLAPPSQLEIQEAANFLSLCGLPARIRILDLGCGHGRYALALAGMGATVFAIDASWSLLQRAVAHAAVLPGTVHWIRADARDLPLRGDFDLALVVDAFGYFDAEDDGLRFLQEARRVLRPRGSLLLRNPNATLIRTHFRAEDEERRGSRTISIKNSLEHHGRWLLQEIAIKDDDGPATFRRRQQIYSSSELQLLLDTAGYREVRHHQDSIGTPYNDQTSSRILTIARTAG